MPYPCHGRREPSIHIAAQRSETIKTAGRNNTINYWRHRFNFMFNSDFVSTPIEETEEKSYGIPRSDNQKRSKLDIRLIKSINHDSHLNVPIKKAAGMQQATKYRDTSIQSDPNRTSKSQFPIIETRVSFSLATFRGTPSFPSDIPGTMCTRIS